MSTTEDFKHQDTDMLEGRLVYYSSDVQEQQMLNFHNMPIYGPTTYNGAPLGLQLAVFELDDTPEELKSVLNFAAKKGAQSFAPASPVLQLLNGLGKSFLNGNQNDTEFKYSMVLAHDGGYLDTLHPVIEAGYYVFIREENRQLSTQHKQKWNDFHLNTDTCQLESDQNTPYIDNTYLVVSINKGQSALKINLAQNTYGKFLKTLSENRENQFTPLQNALSNVLAERVHIENFGRAKELLSVIRGQKPGVPLFAISDLSLLLSNHKVDSDTISETKFSKEQLRFIQAELVDFVTEKKNAPANLDDFTFEKLSKGTLKNILVPVISDENTSTQVSQKQSDSQELPAARAAPIKDVERTTIDSVTKK
ncbi:MAG: hypothetical protein HWE34_16335 [Methylocystaceae bacterium]|nr:hypothetical protein [Methylocystaceae bacterium]